MKFGIDLGGMYESPAYYLERATSVEAAGFDSLWFADHIQPWFHTGGRAPFAYSWIPAALERTDRIPIGVFVTPPIYRYHPLVVANAAATIDEMYPGRFRFAAGTGERMNEHPFVDEWPSWDVRGARTREALGIIERYWTADDAFGYDGEHFAFDPIYPYEQPETALEIYFSATGPKSARLAAEHADHLVTIAALEDVNDRVVDIYREHGGEGEVIFQSVGGFGDADELLERVRQSFAPTLLAETFHMTDPWEIEAKAEDVSDETILDSFILAETAEEVIAWIDEQRGRGADHVVITDVSYEQERFYETAATDILPSL